MLGLQWHRRGRQRQQDLDRRADADRLASDWSNVATGRFHSCGQRGASALYCWGENYDGRVGDGSTLQRLSPSSVGLPGSGNVTSLTAGVGHSCAIRAGRMYCWGSNYTGQVGDGTTTQRLTPTAVNAATDWTAVSTTGNHSCGLRAGALYCWGDNASGQLGDGTMVPRHMPVRVGDQSDWTAIGAGESHTCAVRADELYCWGSNAYGQLARPRARELSPALVRFELE